MLNIPGSGLLRTISKIRGLGLGGPAAARLSPIPVRTSVTGSKLLLARWNTNLPKTTGDKDLRSNEWKSRVPKFPFHKDIEPAIVPKANTPRVSDTLNFKQLMEILYNSKGPELLYMAESHRLYFLACMALTFIISYNLFDLLDRGIRGIHELYKENEDELPPMHNAVKNSGRAGMVGGLALIYILAGLTFAIFPSRLVRRIEYLPGKKEHIRLVTHPWIPGKSSPVITIPLENLSLGKRTKVWSGAGFYGTSQRSSFFFFLFEKGRALPWVVDRSGWYWGDGRVYDVLFGKEPVGEAEKGLSYDDMLVLQQNEVNKQKAEYRRQLGPAWRLKMIGEMVKEDASKIPGIEDKGANKNKKKEIEGERGDDEKKN